MGRSRKTERRWKKAYNASEYLAMRSMAMPSGCVHFTGGLDKNGYGQIQLTRWAKEHQVVKAHRLAYICAFGPFPLELLVCHHCDNPVCINPKHLFLGTNKDNTEDKVRKGRSNHYQGPIKLTEDQVREIKSIGSKRTGRQLAKDYGVSFALISLILLGKVHGNIK